MMPLKSFQILFMFFSAAILAGVGAWQLLSFFQRREFFSLAAAVILLEGALGLIVYLVWFLKKFKNTENPK